MTHKLPARIVQAVKARSGGICEGCHGRPATQIHHRQYRSRGGGDTLENLLHLCGSGNHTGCHGIAHTGKGEQLGWSVRSNIDPATIEVQPLVVTPIAGV